MKMSPRQGWSVISLEQMSGGSGKMVRVASNLFLRDRIIAEQTLAIEPNSEQSDDERPRRRSGLTTNMRTPSAFREPSKTSSTPVIRNGKAFDVRASGPASCQITISVALLPLHVILLDQSTPLIVSHLSHATLQVCSK